MPDFEPHAQHLLLRTTDPRTLGGYFNTLAKYNTSGDSFVELWEVQQEGNSSYYYVWFVFDDMVRIAQYVVQSHIMMKLFVPEVRNNVVSGFNRACAGQYELGISTIGLWLNAGEERLDHHQLLAANRFEDAAEDWEDLEDAVGSLGTKGTFQKPDLPDVIGDTATSFTGFVNNMEMPDETHEDTDNTDDDGSEST